MDSFPPGPALPRRILSLGPYDAAFAAPRLSARDRGARFAHHPADMSLPFRADDTDNSDVIARGMMPIAIGGLITGVGPSSGISAPQAYFTRRGATRIPSRLNPDPRIRQEPPSAAFAALLATASLPALISDPKMLFLCGLDSRSGKPGLPQDAKEQFNRDRIYSPATDRASRRPAPGAGARRDLVMRSSSDSVAFLQTSTDIRIDATGVTARLLRSPHMAAAPQACVVRRGSARCGAAISATAERVGQRPDFCGDASNRWPSGEYDFCKFHIGASRRVPCSST